MLSPARRRMLLALLPFPMLLTSPTASEGPGKPKGALVIVGGGERSDAVMNRFVELAGGRGKAVIAVVPMAS
ncbi:MAG: peptidase S51, partial [Gemmatimonadales bacterium]